MSAAYWAGAWQLPTVTRAPLTPSLLGALI